MSLVRDVLTEETFALKRLPYQDKESYEAAANELLLLVGPLNSSNPTKHHLQQTHKQQQQNNERGPFKFAAERYPAAGGAPLIAPAFRV